MILIFLGPPGAGKGTQAKIIEERFAHRQVSTGDLLRANRAKKTALGLEAQSYMDDGKLVPDDVIIRMMEQELTNASDVIVDGFPRTVAQAQAFDALLGRTGLTAKAVVFDVEKAVLMERLTGRWTNERTGRVYHTLFNPPKRAGIDDDDGGELIQRPDDKAETIEKRLREYDEKTAPLIDYYARTGRAVHINALAEINVVTDEIVRALPGLADDGRAA
jgi:adenylate kinase